MFSLILPMKKFTQLLPLSLLSFCITKTCPCMQYTEIFSPVKIENSMRKNDIFLIFAQNIDCGYTLEPPR